MKEKLIAGFLAAIMALVTGAGPVLAANTVGTYPTFLGTVEDGVGSLDAFVVIGADAATADVVGALDLLLRLGELSYEQVATGGTTSDSGLFTRDGITICTSATPTTACQLIDAESATVQAFPSGQVKNAQFSGLKDSVISWKSTDYDYHEEVDISGVYMSHDFAESNVNGTEKMIIEADGKIFYKYVFDKNLNMSSASGKGTIGTPEYTWPIKIKLLGKDFTIVGIGTNQIKALRGSVGTSTATTPVVYNDYSVYATQGGTTFVQVAIKDANDNTVCTLLLSGWTTGSEVTKTCDAASLDVTVTSIASLQDGTVVGADLVVGDVGKTTKTYDTTSDVTSTGTANDKWSDADPRWGIRVNGFATAGQASIGDSIQVSYHPADTLRLLAGEKITLPEGYADLMFDGWNTDQWATITIEPTSQTAFNQTDTSEGTLGTWTGLKITSDVPSTIVAGGNFYDTAYLLFNRSFNAGATTERFPVALGYWDNSKAKVLINGTFVNVEAQKLMQSGEYIAASAYLNNSAGGQITFPIQLQYGGAGEQTFYINFTVNTSTEIIAVANAGRDGAMNLVFSTYQNKSAWTSTASPEFRLGTGTSAAAADLVATTHATASNIGDASQDVVVDAGLIAVAPQSNAGSQKVVFMIPYKRLAVQASLGLATGVTTSGDTVNAIKKITTPVAVLDTEVTATHKASNLVAVGGSAVNRVSADAMGLTYPTYGSSGLLPFSEGQGYIGVFEGVTGYDGVIVVVAGWEAAQTRTASTVLQQYDTLLEGQTATAVIVTSASTSGITPVTTTTTAAETTTTTVATTTTAA
jgi:hypothetical protein